ncbi:hypothetical protein [Streptomyces diastatochromogenes]|uniref:Uncharacterized protein n=1 Tax=Streptomyces diastatochromogenes TaxID=42236 RepID=A0A233RUX2_STRDA|nr:hypothetical protein [Streptomyces diastatochromogenes]MCZ0984618.1 hypothetical protein [Streptomyces diastatochromogenes]OXY87167.1 hypothetical protein BEK98_44055 [Streptomyces diastatochromogenes]
MSSPCDPKYAPVGDVGAALMMIDSRLKAVYDSRTETDPEQQQMVDQFAASLGPTGVDALLDGVCTLIYMFMEWLRAACEDHDKDVIEYLLPTLVATMRMMPKTFRPEVIPTMAGLLVAASTGLSPNLWRAQYGRWTDAEMNPLEATAVLLAERINRISDDRDFATRLITEALSRSDQG